MEDAADGPGAAAPATVSDVEGAEDTSIEAILKRDGERKQSWATLRGMVAAGRHRKQSWATLRGMVSTHVQVSDQPM